MKYSVKFILTILISFTIFSVISCSDKLWECNNQAVEICNELTDLMNVYTDEIETMLVADDFHNLKEITRKTDSEVSVLLSNLNELRQEETDSDLYNNILVYFNFSKKLLDIGSELSTCTNIDDDDAFDLLKNFVLVSGYHDEALQDVIKSREIFAEKYGYISDNN